MVMLLAMVDSKIVEPAKLDSAYLDFGTFFGDGVYEVLRSYNGRIFALEEHLERFKRSLSEIEIEGIDIEQVRAKVLQAFKACGKDNVKIYFHITRGAGIRNHAAEGLKPRFFLTVYEIEDCSEQKQNGISVITTPDTRWHRCDIKSLNLLPNVLAERKAKRCGCGEAIFVGQNGYITEGASSAFFSVFGNSLVTTPLKANILPSITRKFVLQLAENIGMKIEQKQITAAEAITADELFIAVSSKDIIGVVKFDGNQIADGRVGKYAKLLAEEFKTLALSQ